MLVVIPNNIEDPHVWDGGECLSRQKNPEMIALLKKYHQKGLIEIAQNGYIHQTTPQRPSKKYVPIDVKFYQEIDRRWAAYNLIGGRVQ